MRFETWQHRAADDVIAKIPGYESDPQQPIRVAIIAVLCVGFPHGRRVQLIPSPLFFLDLSRTQSGKIVEDEDQIAVTSGESGIESAPAAIHGDRLLDAPLGGEHVAGIEKGPRKIRPEPERRLKCRGCFLEAALGDKRVSEVVVRFREIGTDGDRALKCRDGLVVPILPAERAAEVREGGGVVGLELDGAFVRGDGVIGCAVHAERDAEIVVSLRVAGLRLNRLPVFRDGFRDEAARDERIAEIAVRLGIARLQLERAAMGGDRLVRPATACEREAEVVVILGGGWVQRNRAGNPIRPEVIVAFLARDETQEVQRFGMARLHSQHLAIDPLGVIEAASLVMTDRDLHGLHGRHFKTTFPRFAHHSIHASRYALSRFRVKRGASSSGEFFMRSRRVARSCVRWGMSRASPVAMRT